MCVRVSFGRERVEGWMMMMMQQGDDWLDKLKTRTHAYTDGPSHSLNFISVYSYRLAYGMCERVCVYFSLID